MKIDSETIYSVLDYYLYNNNVRATNCMTYENIRNLFHAAGYDKDNVFIMNDSDVLNIVAVDGKGQGHNFKVYNYLKTLNIANIKKGTVLDIPFDRRILHIVLNYIKYDDNYEIDEKYRNVSDNCIRTTLGASVLSLVQLNELYHECKNNIKARKQLESMKYERG